MSNIVILENKKIHSRLYKKSRRAILDTAFVFFRMFFALTPTKLSFYLIVLTHPYSERVAFFLARAFMITASKKNTATTTVQYSSQLTNKHPISAATILVRIGAFREAIHVLSANTISQQSEDMHFILSIAYFELGELEVVNEVLKLTGKSWPRNPDLCRMKIFMALLANKENLVLPHLRYVADTLTNGWCPHQNIAAHYPIFYTPNRLDYCTGTNGLLFDAYNLLGQRMTHVGLGHIGLSLYAKAFAIQEKLANHANISEDLKIWLYKKNIHLHELVILATEWVTQIGHLGMMEIQLRMKKLGWWKGKVLLLVPNEELIANKVLVSLFSNQCEIAKVNFNINETLMAELFSLQRYCGLSFNAWKTNDHKIVAWQQAGAKMLQSWDAKENGLTLRDAFDDYCVNNSAQINEQVQMFKEKCGMKPNDWFVCLHVRDAGFYGEMAGCGQTHRNANIESYLSAIRFITSRGGWVIKLGDKKSSKLPQMPGVIDYAHSRFKSELMDIYLIRHARYFIGTTSGLTNIAIVFDKPCALVNCITIDPQLWHNTVRFALKRILKKDGNFLTQRQISSDPWRWRLFDAQVLQRYEATIVNNSADEILETVKEIDHLAQNKDSDVKVAEQSNQLLDKWKKSLAVADFYGGGQPSQYYLSKHEKSFLD